MKRGFFPLCWVWFERRRNVFHRLPALPPFSAPQSLTEEKITLLLQLIREELEHKTEGEKPLMKFTTEALQVHVPACVLALCGWTCRWVVARTGTEVAAMLSGYW